jgi:hypothetical protein
MEKESEKVVKVTYFTPASSGTQTVKLEAQFESAYDARDLKYQLEKKYGLLQPRHKGPWEREKIVNAAVHNIGKIIRKAKFAD